MLSAPIVERLSKLTGAFAADVAHGAGNEFSQMDFRVSWPEHGVCRGCGRSR